MRSLLVFIFTFSTKFHFQVAGGFLGRVWYDITHLFDADSRGQRVLQSSLFIILQKALTCLN